MSDLTDLSLTCRQLLVQRPRGHQYAGRRTVQPRLVHERADHANASDRTIHASTVAGEYRAAVCAPAAAPATHANGIVRGLVHKFNN